MFDALIDYVPFGVDGCTADKARGGEVEVSVVSLVDPETQRLVGVQIPQRPVPTS